MDSQSPEPNGALNIQTSGGAYIDGAVNITGGDFVGHDKITYVGYTSDQVAILIAQIRRDDQPKGWNGRSPYIGLDSFREHQANLFFGREKLVVHLLTRIEASRLLCITGPSGSGKSSLVQAGLIPALHAGKLPNSEQWLFETVTPGNQPLENLALAMGRLARSPAAAEYLRSQGASDPAALHTQIETLLSHHRDQRAVVVVDQFEEIFTQTKNEVTRLAFLALLTNAVQQEGGRVSVLLGMRSDFVSQCAAYPELRKLISGHLELVGAMEPEELARAIALPALEVGVEVKPDLVAQVIADMRGEPGALPLMQFALKDLFDAQPKQLSGQIVLTLQEYLARGGIQQALERHANKQFAEFSGEEQAVARKIFMSLIEVGRGAVDTRRTALFTELLPTGVNPDQVEKVVQALADARLITTDNPLSMRETQAEEDMRNVTIAHEKLIEAWPWLQQLVRENRAAIELQNQISEDAAHWQKNKRDPSYLYTGARLQTVQEQLTANQLTLSAAAQQLIDASVQAETERLYRIEADRQRELAQERLLAEEQRHRAEEQTQAAQSLRRRNQWLGLALAGALVLAFISFLYFRQANDERIRADQKAQEAQIAADARATEVVKRSNAQATAVANWVSTTSRKLALQANAIQATDPGLALLLAVTAAEIEDNPQARGALITSLGSTSEMVVAQVGSTDQATVLTASPSRNLIAVGDAQGVVEVCGTLSNQCPHQINAGTNSAISTLAFDSTGHRLVIGDANGGVSIWDLETNSHVDLNPGFPGQVTQMALNDDGSKLAVVIHEDDYKWRIVILSVNGTAEPIELPSQELIAIEHLSWRDSDTLVVADWGNLLLFSAMTGSLVDTRFVGKPARSGPSAYSNGGDLVVESGFDNGGVFIHDPFTQNSDIVGEMQVENEPIDSIIFNFDDSKLAIAQGGVLTIFDPHGQVIQRIKGLSGVTINMAFSSDSESIATLGNGRVQLWRLTSSNRLGRTLMSSIEDVPSVIQGAIGATFSLAGDQLAWIIMRTDQSGFEIALWEASSDTITRLPVDVDPEYFDKFSFISDHQLAFVGFQPLIQSIDTGTKRIVPVSCDVVLPGLEWFPDEERPLLFQRCSSDKLETRNLEDIWRNLGFGNDKVVKSTLSEHGDIFAYITDRGELVLASSQSLVARKLSLATLGAGSEGTAYGPSNLLVSQDGQLIGLHYGWSQLIVININDLLSRKNDSSVRRADLGSVDALAFSSDSQWLATSGPQGRISLWDAESLELIGTLNGQVAPIRSLKFSPTGKHLAEILPGGGVTLWDIDLESWKRKACIAAGRMMSDAERTRYLPGDDSFIKIDACSSKETN